MSIFDEVEADLEKVDRGIEKPAKAAPAPAVDPDEAEAAAAGISVETLRSVRAQQRRLWPDGQ